MIVTGTYPKSKRPAEDSNGRRVIVDLCNALAEINDREQADA